MHVVFQFKLCAMQVADLGEEAIHTPRGSRSRLSTLHGGALGTGLAGQAFKDRTPALCRTLARIAQPCKD